MEVFSANPKSFKIRRSSLLASSKLKPAISAQLSRFLPELTDDIFAEYVTVLVCNGKNQYQVREDLDAFLGDRSEEFVSWLWDHILECIHPGSSLKNREGFFSRSRNSNRDADTRTRRSTRRTEDLLACNKEISYKVSSGEGTLADIDTKKPKQTCDREALPELKEISYFSIRDSAQRNSLSSVSDHPSFGKGRISTSLIPARKYSAPTDRPSISVWDRLGKPSNNIDDDNQDEKVPRTRSSIACGLVEGEASLRNKASEELKRDKNGKLQTYVSRTFEQDSSSNIRRKRLLPETGGNPTSLKENKMSVSTISEMSQELKKSKLSSKDLKMIEVKQRLHTVEMELSKLRSKQVNINIDGKACQMPNPNELTNLVDDIDSRTIFVSNVHFAATEDALSLFFAPCGVIVDVVKTIDLETSKPNGSAYVTFASKDSIDRALDLSGTTFFSRIVKVSRMEEQEPPQASLSSQVNSVKPYFSASRLQWRRDNANCD